jgi:hypothetical protein
MPGNHYWAVEVTGRKINTHYHHIPLLTKKVAKKKLDQPTGCGRAVNSRQWTVASKEGG